MEAETKFDMECILGNVCAALCPANVGTTEPTVRFVILSPLRGSMFDTGLPTSFGLQLAFYDYNLEEYYHDAFG